MTPHNCGREAPGLSLPRRIGPGVWAYVGTWPNNALCGAKGRWLGLVAYHVIMGPGHAPGARRAAAE